MENAFLRKLRGFANLSSAAMAAVRNATSRTRRFQAKTNLVREGDAPGPIIVVLDGWLCRYNILLDGPRQNTGIMMPGDNSDLFDRFIAKTDHSIQALSTVEVAFVPYAEMRQLLDAHPSFFDAMQISQMVDANTMRSAIVSMGRRNSQERVAHMICELYLRADAVGITDGRRLALPLSQSALADTLGMTTVHMNRVLRDLRLRGVLELRRGVVLIKEPIALVEIASFNANYLHLSTKPLSAHRLAA